MSEVTRFTRDTAFGWADAVIKRDQELVSGLWRLADQIVAAIGRENWDPEEAEDLEQDMVIQLWVALRTEVISLLPQASGAEATA